MNLDKNDLTALQQKLEAFQQQLDAREKYISYREKSNVVREDLIDENRKIKFYLPFDDFKTRPTFSDANEYLLYKKGVMTFIKSRNKRIENYTKLKMPE